MGGVPGDRPRDRRGPNLTRRRKVRAREAFHAHAALAAAPGAPISEAVATGDAPSLAPGARAPTRHPRDGRPMFDGIVALVERTGYLGVALLMFAENVFPPIPSELIMPLAGFSAARGTLSLPLVVLAGVAGSLAGLSLWYAAGRALGLARVRRLAARHGRWLTLGPEEVDAADAWFRRHGPVAVALGRLVPAVRTLISVPAGVSGMGSLPFLLWSAAGTVVWTSLLAGAGYLLEAQYDRVAAYLDPVSNVVVALLVAAYLYRVARFRSAPPG